jgi:hypothetical protein
LTSPHVVSRLSRAGVPLHTTRRSRADRP